METQFFYKAVGNLCAASFEPMNMQRSDEERTPVSAEEALEVLQSEPLNYELVHQGFDGRALEPLRQLVGKTSYRLKADMSEAPHVFDCSSLMKWFFGLYGICLPRLTIQQSEMGLNVTNSVPYRCGDLILSEGRRNFFRKDQSWGIGHVGVATGNGTMFHIRRGGVIEEDISKVVGPKFERFRAARRLIVDPDDFYVLRTQPDGRIETSDCMKWLVLQHLREQQLAQFGAA